MPDAGWIAYDPAIGLIGDRRLIRFAVGRDPALASPVAGRGLGGPQACLGMAAEGRVRRRNTDPQA